MKADDIVPGRTYRLTKDIVNSHPDKRERDDWRAFPVWKAGLQIIGSYQNVRPLGTTRPTFFHKYHFMEVDEFDPKWPELLANLEPVETVESFLQEISEVFSVDPTEILSHIIEQRLITREQVREIAAMLERHD